MFRKTVPVTRHSFLSLYLVTRVALCWLALVLLNGSDAHAQWRMLAPSLLAPMKAERGAIVHKGNATWAGATRIFLSTDQGKSWVERFVPIGQTDVVRYIDIFDDSTALVSLNEGSLYETTDQGKTWKLLQRFSSNFGARYLGDRQHIVVPQGAFGTISVTTDGGRTWTNNRVGQLVQFIVPLTPGRAYALIGGQNRKVTLSLTTDFGITWNRLSDSVAFLDSYSFGVDPCGEEKVYVVNEDAGGTPNNGMAEMFVSNNGGKDWIVTYERPVRDLVGSIAVASNAVYAQTVARGVIRSTDYGATWKDIGGPSAPFDTRLVCAIDDNRVLAADHDGTLWVTENAGGDSVFGPTRIKEIGLSRYVLFDTDTLYSCDDPVFDTAILRGIFCSAPEIARIDVEGSHASDFTLVKAPSDQLSGRDSLVLRFYPGGNGSREANLVIVLKDSTTLTLPLRGYGRGLSELQLTSSRVSSDTVGVEVYVPIIFAGSDGIEGVELDVTYASSQLEYVRTVDRMGTTADLGLEPIGKRHPVRLTAPWLNDTIGYAIFRIYPNTEACVPVTFDSIRILSTKPPCAFGINSRVVTEVCMPNDCNTRIVTGFMRFDKRPTLALTQQNKQLVLRSELNHGEVHMRVYSVLGQLFSELRGELSSDHPIVMSLANVPKGFYQVQVVSQLDSQTFRLSVGH